MTERLITPPEESGLASAIEHCELMIEESIEDVRAIQAGRRPSRPSYRGELYDEGYAQGRKDACRVVLLAARDREHVTSADQLELPPPSPIG